MHDAVLFHLMKHFEKGCRLLLILMIIQILFPILTFLFCFPISKQNPKNRDQNNCPKYKKNVKISPVSRPHRDLRTIFYFINNLEILLHSDLFLNGNLIKHVNSLTGRGKMKSGAEKEKYSREISAKLSLCVKSSVKR